MENKESRIIKEVTTKDITLNDLKPGMVLAKDIVSPSGKILLAKNTVITEAGLKRLLDSSVKDVQVKEARINRQNEERITFTDEERAKILDKPQNKTPEIVSVASKEDFQKFARKYEEKLEEAKSQIKAISDGENVNIEELFEITNSIVKQLRSKSDVLTYVSFLREHDEYTYSHSSNVALLSNLFSYWLDYDEQQTANLTTAGLLHDLGKLKIPLEILNKKGKLTEEEFAIIKTHPVLGYRILQSQNIPEEMKLAALMHHEKIDGSGYPIGAKDEKINRFAKIIAICDIYDAMTANRAYRNRICPFEVIKQFEISSYGELDTSFLLTFLSNIAYTYFGSWIRLSDGSLGEIVFIHQNDLSRPVVRVGNELIDLQRNPKITIVDIL